MCVWFEYTCSEAKICLEKSNIVGERIHLRGLSYAFQMSSKHFHLLYIILTVYSPFLVVNSNIVMAVSCSMVVAVAATSSATSIVCILELRHIHGAVAWSNCDAGRVNIMTSEYPRRMLWARRYPLAELIWLIW